MIHDILDPKSLLGKLARRYQAPGEPFDPAGSWSHLYRDCAALPNYGHRGDLRLSREPGEAGATLTVQQYRLGPQEYNYHARARLHCADDTLATPSAWTVDTKVATAADAPAYLHSGMHKEANVRNGVLTVSCGDDKVRTPLPGAYTCKWCLVDAVQRLAPAPPAEPIAFTLLDEYDEAAPGSELRARGTFDVPLRNGTQPLTCFQHTGRGVVPATFWLDAAGRLLFYVAGVQILVLTETDGRPLAWQ